MSAWRRLVLCGSLFVAAGCGREEPAGGVDPFAKSAPSLPRTYHGRTIAQWNERMASGGAEARAEFAWALGELGDDREDALDLLTALLEDESPNVQHAALAGLQRRGVVPADGTESLLELADSEHPGIRLLARRLVLSMGVENLEALLEALQSAEASVRLEALELIGRLHRDGGGAWSSVEEVADNDPEPEVRRTAIRILPLLGPPGRAACLRRLESTSMDIQREAAAGLAATQDIDGLLAPLAHERLDVAYWATSALAGMGPHAREATAALIVALARPNPVRQGAVRALVAIGPPAVTAVQERLASAESAAEAEIAAACRTVLQRIEEAQGN